MRRRYVVSKLAPKAPPLPVGRYDDPRTFVDTDGVEYHVTSGRMPTGDWPTGVQSDVALRTVGHPVVTP